MGKIGERCVLQIMYISSKNLPTRIPKRGLAIQPPIAATLLGKQPSNQRNKRLSHKLWTIWSFISDNIIYLNKLLQVKHCFTLLGVLRVRFGWILQVFKLPHLWGSQIMWVPQEKPPDKKNWYLICLVLQMKSNAFDSI